MYLGKWKINDNLAFACNTHSPTTGAASAATSVTYSVYEDVSGTVLTSGTMTAVSGYGTGMYSATMALTSGLGFENNKTYTIRIQATVGGVTAALLHTFQVESILEGTITESQALKLILSSLAGRSSGGGIASITFRDTANSVNRIVATVDSSGNRTAVTLNGA